MLWRKWKGRDIMCRCRMGNPKKMSRFICLKCLQIGIPGIQRKSQREKYHVKDLFCTYCKQETKHIEIRHCDYLPDIMKKAIRKHNELYDDNVTEVETDFYGTISI